MPSVRLHGKQLVLDKSRPICILGGIMSKITYKTLLDSTSTAVYLEGRRIGTIRCGHVNYIESFDETGWTYFPKGSIQGGETFYTLAACKASLEAE